MTSTLHISYHLLPSSITNRQARDVPAILSVDALLTITVDETTFFSEEVSILEFYKALHTWSQAAKTEPFRYYTIEHDDPAPLIALIPGEDMATLTSCWSGSSPKVPLNKAITAFTTLEKELRDSIENTYGIRLTKFLPHIPARWTDE